MKKYITLLSLVLISAAAFAGDAGRTALPFLKMDMGARYYGMAGAATAFADDAMGGAFYNAAALGRVQAFQVAASTFEDKLDMKAQQFLIASPIPFLSFFGNNPLNISVNAYMYDKGDLDIVNRSAGKDMSFSLSIAEHIASSNWDFAGSTVNLDQYIGITGKYLKSTLPSDMGGDVKGDSFAFDAGYQIVADNHFGIGLAAKNIGSGIKYINVKDPLPATLSAGIFFVPVDVDIIKWSISADYINYIKEKEDRVRVGTEAVFMDILAVRGGVRLMEEIDTEYTLGFGLKLFGFEVDFGTILNPQFNDDKVYQASIAYKFPVKKERKITVKEEKRDTYREYQEKKARQAQENAQRNTSPILYQ